MKNTVSSLIMLSRTGGGMENQSENSRIIDRAVMNGRRNKNQSENSRIIDRAVMNRQRI